MDSTLQMNSAGTVIFTHRFPRAAYERARIALPIGYFKNKSIAVVVNTVFFDKSTDLPAEITRIESHLPVGYDVIGICETPATKNLGSSIESYFGQFSVTKHQLLSLKGFSIDQSLPQEVELFVFQDDLWNPEMKLQILEAFGQDPFRRSSITIRLDFVSALEIYYPGTGAMKMVLEKSLNDLEDRLVHPSHLFKSEKSNTFLNRASLKGQVDRENFTLFDLWKFENQDEKLLKKKELTFSQDFLKFEMFCDSTFKNKIDHSNKLYVPVIYSDVVELTRRCIPLRLKAIAVCQQDTKLKLMPNLLRKAVSRQLQLIRNFFDSLSEVSIFILTPRPFCFYNSLSDHFILTVFPHEMDDSQLKGERVKLSIEWNLLQSRPFFRKMNDFKFPDQWGPYLRNVHQFAGFSGIKGGSLALVQGDYEYRHYMQDNFNDQGWGCAYRSFQTIWSWLLLQGYTEKPVPCHRQIQQALVDIGDKEANFVGSKQWIGSLELSYCLSFMLQIESKILSVSNGSELTSQIDTLMDHFRNIGCPVMIGGGVLAHTIIGVHFNEDTGEAKFLVLDPHYTNQENIRTILDKGWCGWKGVNFWSRDSFYNLLIPQLPVDCI